MRTIALIVCGVFLTGTAWAATVNLKSGTSVSGDVIEVSADRIKVSVEGVGLTYYSDEIVSVDGDENAARTLGVPSSGMPAAAAPAPVEVQPEPAAPVVAAVPEVPVIPVVEPVAPPAPEPAAPAVVPPAAPVVDVVSPAENAASAPMSADKKGKILKFIEVFGTRDTMKMNFDQILGSMPPQEAEKMKGAFNIEEVIEALVPLYDKYFSAEDLDAFIAFYSSPNGRKLVQTIPLIMKESIDVSAKYFEEHMPEEFKNAPLPEQQ